MVRYAFAAGFAVLVGLGLSPAAQTCGSTPNDAQLARRKTAINAARQINTAEARAFQAAQKYMPLQLLKTVTVPEGFDVQVSTDGETYNFSIKDTTDQCQVAVFSDQKGVIYTGTPLQ